MSYQLSAISKISYQLSAVSYQLESRPLGSPNPEGRQKRELKGFGSWVPVWRKPEHRRALGERPEGGADRMSAPDLLGRMPRKISAGPKA